MSFLTKVNMKVEGDFRSGTLLKEWDEKVFPLLENDFMIVTFDLTDVVFMDSSSMSSILFAENHGGLI